MPELLPTPAVGIVGAMLKGVLTPGESETTVVVGDRQPGLFTDS